MTYAVAGPGGEQAGDENTKRPVRVHDITLKDTGNGKRGLPRTGTEPFSMLGVTWTGAAKKLDGSAQVRTRSSETGEWGDWQDLDADESHPPEKPEPGLRGGSEPLWVGPSDGVEVRVVAADGTSETGLPKGLKVSLVDPGVTAAETKSVGSGLAPVAYAAETSPADTPAPVTGTPTDNAATPSATPTDSAAPTDSGAPTGSVPP
ncbi:N-acetylmuramoyl-L-alanine amidase, partial [Streptomyces sp. GC420]|nr:N-acetylmuramoyl-L-alanine amidase [Streptomyces sp. GC420]